MMQIMLVLRAATAEVERGFPAMNDIMVPARSNLSFDHLDTLMRVTLTGPELGTAHAESIICQAHAHWSGPADGRTDRIRQGGETRASLGRHLGGTGMLAR